MIHEVKSGVHCDPILGGLVVVADSLAPREERMDSGARFGPGPRQADPPPLATLTLALSPNVRLSWPGQLITDHISNLQTCTEGLSLSAAHLPAPAPGSGTGLGPLPPPSAFHAHCGYTFDCVRESAPLRVLSE